MKHKTLTIIASILLVGIMSAGFTSADRIIDNATGIYIEDFVAGSTAQANFSYEYIRDRPENPDNSPLILKISINSSDEENFPVWMGDFEINGYIKRYILFGLILVGEKHFTCSEQKSQIIIHPLGNELVVSAENGTFYCYDPEGDLDFGDFNAHDIVYLDITSNPALWPGQYNLEAKLFYLSDTYPPIVTILNRNYFDQYFRDGSYVDFEVEIIDINLIDYNAKIITPEQNFSFSKEHVSGNVYRFYMTLPNEIPEGDLDVLVTAVDSEGNIGSDSTTLRIDRTPPTIEFVGPIGIVSDEFSIKFNVTDEKADVDNESVKVRLREIVNSQICPETGGVIGEGNFSCITTPWINLTLVDGLFEVDINTTKLNLTSGEYWLDAVASDILGNKAEWIA